MLYFLIKKTTTAIREIQNQNKEVKMSQEDDDTLEKLNNREEGGTMFFENQSYVQNERNLYRDSNNHEKTESLLQNVKRCNSPVPSDTEMEQSSNNNQLPIIKSEPMVYDENEARKTAENEMKLVKEIISKIINDEPCSTSFNSVAKIKEYYESDKLCDFISDIEFNTFIDKLSRRIRDKSG